MTLVVGTDEAGYGPNLGPLVVAATLWDVAGPAAEAEAILAAASAALDDPWRDSKQVYRGGSGWAALEHGALAALTIATGAAPADWRSLVAAGAVPEAAGEPPMVGGELAAATVIENGGSAVLALPSLTERVMFE